MARVRFNHNTFSAGVISKKIQGNVDFQEYNNALDECENFQVMPTGGVLKRAGSEYIKQTKNNAKVRLIPFTYSSNNSYVLEFGALYIRFYELAGAVSVGGGDLEKATTFTWEDVKAIRYFQMGLDLYLNTPKGIFQLSLKGKDDFELYGPIVFTVPPATFPNEEEVALKPSAVSGTITITAVDPVNSAVKPNIKYAPVFYPEDVGGYIVMTYTSTSNEKRIYYIKIEAVTPDGETGFNKVTGTINPEYSYYDQSAEDGHRNDLPTLNAILRWQISAFNSVRGFPKAITMFEGRMFLANTAESQLGVWGSSLMFDDFFDFSLGGQPADSVQIQATMEKSDEILWIDSQSKLFFGTRGGVYIAGPAGAKEDPIGPANFRARLFDSVGSNSLQPVKAMDTLFFVDTTGTNVHEIILNNDTGLYQANDLSLIANDLTQSGIIDHAWQQTPMKTYWAAVKDGSMCSLTYLKNNGIFAWAKQVLGGRGVFVEAMCTMPTAIGDFIWISVRREINSEIVRSIEYLKMPFNPVSDSDFEQHYLDSSKVYSDKIGIENIHRSKPIHIKSNLLNIRGGGLKEEYIVMFKSESMRTPLTNPDFNHTYNGRPSIYESTISGKYNYEYKLAINNGNAQFSPVILGRTKVGVFISLMGDSILNAHKPELAWLRYEIQWYDIPGINLMSDCACNHGYDCIVTGSTGEIARARIDNYIKSSTPNPWAVVAQLPYPHNMRSRIAGYIDKYFYIQTIGSGTSNTHLYKLDLTTNTLVYTAEIPYSRGLVCTDRTVNNGEAVMVPENPGGHFYRKKSNITWADAVDEGVSTVGFFKVIETTESIVAVSTTKIVRSYNGRAWETVFTATPGTTITDASYSNSSNIPGDDYSLLISVQDDVVSGYISYEYDEDDAPFIKWNPVRGYNGSLDSRKNCLNMGTHNLFIDLVHTNYRNYGHFEATRSNSIAKYGYISFTPIPYKAKNISVSGFDLYPVRTWTGANSGQYREYGTFIPDFKTTAAFSGDSISMYVLLTSTQTVEATVTSFAAPVKIICDASEIPDGTEVILDGVMYSVDVDGISMPMSTMSWITSGRDAGGFFIKHMDGSNPIMKNIPGQKYLNNTINVFKKMGAIIGDYIPDHPENQTVYFGTNTKVELNEGRNLGNKGKGKFAKIIGQDELNNSFKSLSNVQGSPNNVFYIRETTDSTYNNINSSGWALYDPKEGDNGSVYMHLDFANDKIRGLKHLRGENVAICINGNADTNRYTVQYSEVDNDGYIDDKRLKANLKDAYYVTVGIPYTSKLKTVPFSGGSLFGSSVGSIGSQKDAVLNLYCSLGGKYGTEFSNMYPIPYKDTGTRFDRPLPLYSGLTKLSLTNSQDVYNRVICIEHDRPIAFNMLCITQDVMVSDS